LVCGRVIQLPCVGYPVFAQKEGRDLPSFLVRKTARLPERHGRFDKGSQCGRVGELSQCGIWTNDRRDLHRECKPVFIWTRAVTAAFPTILVFRRIGSAELISQSLPFIPMTRHTRKPVILCAIVSLGRGNWQRRLCQAIRCGHRLRSYA
jgi:hypothetical protein